MSQTATPSRTRQTDQRQHFKGTRKAAALGALALTAAGLIGGSTATSASAASVYAQCTTPHEIKAVTAAPDKHRAGANCSNISAGGYVRAYLDMEGCCDKESVWFNGLYTTKWTAWAQGWYQNNGISTKVG